MSETEIRVLSAAPQTLEMLTQMLLEVVENGGSVGFIHPLERDKATTFWQAALAAAARGERVILGAWDEDLLVSTVTLLLECPPNQPHRAEIAKMMTRVSHRGRGIASSLLRAAENLAVEQQKTLLVLDTATDGGASHLYQSLGYVLTGEIPDYALKPHGGLTGTLIYWRRIGETSEKTDKHVARLEPR